MNKVMYEYFTKEELKELKKKSLGIDDEVKTASGNVGRIVEIYEMSNGRYFQIQVDNFQYMIHEDKIILDIY